VDAMRPIVLGPRRDCVFSVGDVDHEQHAPLPERRPRS
jgi:hypothetical protein